MKKGSLLAFSLVIAFYLIPGSAANWQESLLVEGRIKTTKWTGANSADLTLELNEQQLTEETAEEHAGAKSQLNGNEADNGMELIQEAAPQEAE